MRAYWPDSGELQRGIMLPPEFAAAVRVFLGQVARNVRPSPNTLPPEEREAFEELRGQVLEGPNSPGVL